MTQQSQSGILIFVQNALIIGFSKWQNTVEGTTFGSELIAARSNMQGFDCCFAIQAMNVWCADCRPSEFLLW
jgi:hypothetical protein